MADPNASKQQTLLKMQMREVMNNAYAFVRGRQYNQTIASITYEELLDRAIDRIEGTQGRSDVRGTLLDRINKIKAEIGQAIDTVKKQPTSFWGLSSDDRVSPADAQNTEEDAG